MKLKNLTILLSALMALCQGAQVEAYNKNECQSCSSYQELNPEAQTYAARQTVLSRKSRSSSAQGCMADNDVPRANESRPEKFDKGLRDFPS